MTKKTTVVVIVIATVLLSGAAVFIYLDRANRTDQPTDGGYLYQNRELGFSLILPQVFQYWQVQRKNSDSSIDIEFFVPSSDFTISQEVPGYAKLAVVRIYRDSRPAPEEEFEKLGSDKDRLYAIRFWQSPPGDWAERWKNELKDEIIRSFKIK